MTRKKILWLCSWYPSASEPFNGDFIRRHARAAALYHDIFVIHIAADTKDGIPGKEKTGSAQPGLTEYVYSFKKSLSWWGRLKGHYRLLRAYRRAIRKFIQENGRPDIVHVHVPIWAGLPALRLKKDEGVPLVVTEHWGIYNEIEQNNYRKKNARFKAWTKAIFESADRVTSVSNYLAEGVNATVTKKAWDIIPNVVDTNFFRYHPKTGGPFRFIHVSNMVPLKNADRILRVFSRLHQINRNTELVMVGDASPRIRELVAAGLVPGSVIFKGEISYEAVAKEMQEADCLVLFSSIENSPCVIGEALCSGIPVIATGVGGIPELVDPSNSILVEPGNESALLKAMEEMISGDGRFEGRKISERASAKFNCGIVGKQFDSLYRSI